VARFFTKITELPTLPETEKEALEDVSNQFAFRVTEYYQNLINWDDPNDPLRRIAIPSTSELQEYGSWDPSDESDNYAAPGCQHKYPPDSSTIGCQRL
jgi:lysine 2,3-aminomutase